MNDPLVLFLAVAHLAILAYGVHVVFSKCWREPRQVEERVAHDLVRLREEHGVDPELFLIGMVGQAQAMEIEEEDARVMGRFLARRRHRILRRVQALSSH